ncbi:hypothetical protein TYRP_014048 [Tyrophagus putrescentiae]|nr:hypothetical protein TYRP_014048 [Tyrophagus putrescentiae]
MQCSAKHFHRSFCIDIGSKFMLSNPKCNEQYLQETDNVVAKLLSFGPNGRPFPENDKELKSYCQETTQLADQVDRFFRDCYQKDIRDMASVMVYSLKRVLRQFCSSKGSRNSRVARLLESAHSHVESMKCSTDVLESVPCLRKNKDFLLSFVREIFGNFVGNFCRDLDHCNELSPLPPPKSIPERKYNTFLFVLLDLLESFKSFDIPK